MDPWESAKKQQQGRPPRKRGAKFFAHSLVIKKSMLAGEITEEIKAEKKAYLLRARELEKKVEKNNSPQKLWAVLFLDKKGFPLKGTTLDKLHQTELVEAVGFLKDARKEHGEQVTLKVLYDDEVAPFMLQCKTKAAQQRALKDKKYVVASDGKVSLSTNGSLEPAPQIPLKKPRPSSDQFLNLTAS